MKSEFNGRNVGIDMNEKLKQIEKTFLEEREINLGKQCKGEYIIYNFNLADKTPNL